MRASARFGGGGAQEAPTSWFPFAFVSAPGSGNIIVPAGCYWARTTCQGPGGAGGKAAGAGVQGASGGSGSRTRKIIRVTPGQVIPYSVGQGGQTAGANGTGATTFGSAGPTQLIAPAGSGATNMAAAGAGKGLGGALPTTGDENIAGADGGTANYQGTNGTGANGAGAPYELGGLLVPGSPGRFEPGASGPNYPSEVRFGGKGHYYNYAPTSPTDAAYLAYGSYGLPGRRGAGGGGGSSYATDGSQADKQFTKGGDGELIVEIGASNSDAEQNDPTLGIPFRGYLPGRRYNSLLPGHMTYSSSTGQISWSVSTGNTLVLPFVIKKATTIDRVGVYCMAVGGAVNIKFALYNANVGFLQDIGVASTGAGGTVLVEAALSKGLDPGLYCLVIKPQSGVVVVAQRAITSAANAVAELKSPFADLFGDKSHQYANFTSTIITTSAYADAWPASLPEGDPAFASSFFGVVYWRIAS